MGGPSAEREVSLSTGKECAAALRDAGYSVVEIDAGDDLVQRLRAEAPDRVFNALHGRWGEDGCVQGLLEWLRIPYTHSGVLASALAMDKERAKAAFRNEGLPVVESLLASKAEVGRAHVMAPPYVVKPYNEGSSVGVYLVTDGANGPPLMDEKMPETVMVETYVPGRDLTCSVLDGEALCVTDIYSEGWYDYHAKYSEGGSRHVVPAEVPADVYAACTDYAERAHRVLGCRGLSRTDFRWDDSRGLDGLVVLETNTQPGMTPTSLAPEQAAHRGISFPDLCARLVEDASCDR
ncbi:D-alanine--D-alanine ligase [Pelagovum pacificum]|uniref:D-alanine--D-alanine ligase n=2 Tax=Pelagovum pacificum TaxID=2588711 RepID=A0A5C5G8A0_9RHOB|nr:D-alanine--D-alanine ligase [Pelagovum pacificum]QQA41839.1 D-alanine--D-alanine ligase [Pelagovum pacificum]TNY30781.1 D-alanine--D-alanine ligase [Pelagovum pacificum]